MPSCTSSVYRRLSYEIESQIFIVNLWSYAHHTYSLRETLEKKIICRFMFQYPQSQSSESNKLMVHVTVACLEHNYLLHRLKSV